MILSVETPHRVVIVYAAQAKNFDSLEVFNHFHSKQPHSLGMFGEELLNARSHGIIKLLARQAEKVWSEPLKCFPHFVGGWSIL